MTKIKERHAKMIRSEVEDKTHYKLYKSGKNWLVCGITVFTFAAGASAQAVKADSTTKDSDSDQKVNNVNSSDNVLQKKSVALSTNNKSSDATTQSVSTTSGEASSSNAASQTAPSTDSNAVTQADQTVNKTSNTSAESAATSKTTVSNASQSSAVQAKSTTSQATTNSSASEQSKSQTSASQASNSTSQQAKTNAQSVASQSSSTDANTAVNKNDVQDTTAAQSATTAENSTVSKLNTLTSKDDNNLDDATSTEAAQANQQSTTSQAGVAAESAATQKATAVSLSTLATVTKLLPEKTTVSFTSGMLTIALPAGVDPAVAKRAVKAAGINGPVSISALEADTDLAFAYGKSAAVGDIQLLNPTQFSGLQAWIKENAKSGDPETIDNTTRQLAVGKWYQRAMKDSNVYKSDISSFDKGYLSLMAEMMVQVNAYVANLTSTLSEKSLSFDQMQTMANGIFNEINIVGAGSSMIGGNHGADPSSVDATNGVVASVLLALDNDTYLQLHAADGSAFTDQDPKSLLPKASTTLTNDYSSVNNDFGFSNGQSESSSIDMVLNNIIPTYVAIILNSAEYQTAYNAFHSQNTLGVAPSQSVSQDYINEIIDEHATDVATQLGMPEKIGDLVLSMPMLDLSKNTSGLVDSLPDKNYLDLYGNEQYSAIDATGTRVVHYTGQVTKYGVFEEIYTALKTDIIKAIAGTYMLQRNTDLAAVQAGTFDSTNVVQPDFTNASDVIVLAKQAANYQVSKLVPVRKLGQNLTAGTPLTQTEFNTMMENPTSSTVYDADFSTYSDATKALYYNMYLSGVGKQVSVTFKSADKNAALQTYLASASTKSPVYAQVGTTVDYNLLDKEGILPYLPAGYEYAPVAQQDTATTIADSDSNTYSVTVAPAAQSVPVYFTDASGKAITDLSTNTPAQVNLSGVIDSKLDALSGDNLATINKYVQSLYSVNSSNQHTSYALVANQTANSDSLTATTSFTLQLTQAYSVTVKFANPNDPTATFPTTVQVNAAEGAKGVDLTKDAGVVNAVAALNHYRLATDTDLQSGETQPTDVNFTATTDGTTVTIYVVKNNIQRPVQYVDAVTGTTIAANAGKTVTLTGVEGSTLADPTSDSAVTAGMPTDYKLATGNELNGMTQLTNLTFDNSDPATVYVVKKAQVNVTTNLSTATKFAYTVNGGTATDGTFGTAIDAYEGDQLVITAGKVTGYTVTAPQTLTMAATNASQTFAYTAKSIKVTIKHVDTLGNSIGTNATQAVDFGSTYYDNADAVDGYTLKTASDADKVVKTMSTETDQEVKYVYQQNATATLTLADKTYDGTALTPTLTLTAPNQPLQTFTLKADDYQLTNDDAQAPSGTQNAGTYTVKLTQAGVDAITAAYGNNHFADLATISAKGTIATKTVTVKGTDVTVPYDNKPHSLTAATFTGLVGTTTPTVTYSDSGTDAGTYELLPTVSADSNYSYTINAGKLTISQLATNASLTGTETGKTYDGSPISFEPKLQFTVTDLGDQNPAYTLTGTDFQVYDLTAKKVVPAPVNNAGKYQLQLTETAKTAIANANKNYAIDFSKATYNYDILKKDVNVTVNAGSSAYDGQAHPATYTSDPLVGNDKLTLPTLPSLTNVGSIDDVTPTTLKATDNPNYSVKFIVPTKSLAVTAAGIKSQINANDKVYDGQNVTLTNPTVSFTRVDGQTKAVPTTYALQAGDYTVESNAAKVGTYTVKLTAAGLTNIQAKYGANYTFVAADVVNGTAKITPRSVTVTYADNTVTYNGQPQHLNRTVQQASGVTADEGLVAGETLEIDDDAATAAGSYTNLQGTAKANSAVDSNYDIHYQPGTLTINALTGDAAIKSGNAVITTGSSTYNGQTVDYQPTLVYGNQKVALTPDQYTMTKTTGKTGTTVTEIKDAGAYQIKLTAAYLATLKSDTNYSINNWDSLSGTYTVNPMSVTATVGDIKHPYNGHGDTATVTFNTVTPDVLTFTNLNTYTNVTDSGTTDVAFTADPNYDVTLNQGTVAITPVAVTMTLNGGQRTYNGQAISATDYTPQVTFENQANSALIPSLTETPLTFEDVTVANNDGSFGNHAITLSTTGVQKVTADKNYSYSNLAMLTSNYQIAAASATVTLGFENATKVYDAQNISVVPTITFSDSGSLTPINLTLTAADLQITNAAKLEVTDTKNAGTYTYRLTETGKSRLKQANPNFTFTGLDSVATYTIATRPVTVNFNNATVTYDGSGHSLDYTVAAATANTGWLEAAAPVITKDSDQGHVNVADDPSFGGTAPVNANYQFTINAGQLTINKAPASASFKVTGKVYDGQPINETNYRVTLASDQAANKLVQPTIAMSDITGLENAVDAKTYQIKLTTDAIKSIQGKNPNFAITGLDTATNYTIAQRRVTITINQTTSSFTYDGTAHALTATAEAENTTDNTGLITGKPLAYTLQNNNQVNAGQYTVTMVPGDNPNYTLSSTPVNFTIAKQAQTVTMNSTSGKTYDGQVVDYAPTVTIAGEQHQLANTPGDQQYEVEDNSANAGSYTIKLTTQGATDLQTTFSNYDLSDLTNLTTSYTIAPKDVKLNVTSDSLTYDGQAHRLSAAVDPITPLVGTDQLVYTLSDATEGHTQVSATPYQVSLTVNAADNPNYTVEATGGTLTIKAAAVSIAMNAADKTYDGGNVLPTLTLTTKNTALQSGIVLPDLTAEDMDGKGDFTNTNTDSHQRFGDVGSYTIKLSDDGIKKLQNANPNLDFTNAKTVSATADITPAAVKMAVADDQKVYDGQSIQLVPQFSLAPQTAGQDVGKMIINASDLPDVFTNADFDYNQTATNAGSYTVAVNPTSMATLISKMYNYSIEGGISAGTYKITKRPVSVSLSNDSVVYDGASHELTPTTAPATDSTGLVSGQKLDFNETAQINVGSYPMTVTFPADGQVNQNYQLEDAQGKAVTSLTANLQITAGTTTATLTLNKASKEFDGQTIAQSGLTPTLTINNQAVTLTSQDLLIENDAAKVGKYTVQLNDTALTNLKQAYPNLDQSQFSAATTSIEIVPKPITIEVTGGQHEYDGQPHSVMISNPDEVAGTAVNYTSAPASITDVGSQNIVVTAGENPDYTVTISQADNLVEVTAKPATVTLAVGTGSHAYDGQGLPELTVALSASTEKSAVQPKAVSGLVAGTDYTVTSSATANGAGTYTLTLTTAGEKKITDQTGNSNFKFDFSKAPSTTYQIAKLPVSFTMPTESKVYDGKTVSYDPSQLTLTNQDQTSQFRPKLGTLTAADFDITNSDSTVTDGDASDSYTVKMKQTTWDQIIANNPNFDFSALTLPETTYAVTKRAVVLKVNSNTDTPATYDGQAKTVTAEATDPTSVVAGQTLDINLKYADAITGTPLTGDIVNAGTYTVTAEAGNGEVNKNYAITAGNGQMVIQRAVITDASLKLSKNSKIYDGQSINANDFTGTLKFAGPSIELPFTDYAIADNSKNVQPAGYQVKLSTAAQAELVKNQNYDLQGLDKLAAAFKIEPKAVTLTITDGSAVYDGQPHVSTVAVSAGLVGDETLALSTVASETAVGTYDAPKALSDNAVNANYQITVAGNQTFTISKKTATIALGSGSKDYDGQSVSFAPTVTLTATNEGNNLVQPTGNVVLTPDDVTVEQNAANAGTYTVKLNQAGLTKIEAAGNNANFDFGALDQVASTTYQIKPQAATISFVQANKVYDGTDTINFTPVIKLASTSLAVGAVQPAEVTLTADDITVANNAKDANTYYFSLNTAGKALVQANQNFTYADLTVNGDYVIAKRPVNITVDQTAKAFTGTALSPEVTVQPADNQKQAGVIAGETLGYTLPEETNVGDYQTSVTVKSNEEASVNKNYAITAVAGAFSITATAATYAFAAGSRIFDGKKVASGWTPTLQLGTTSLVLDNTEYQVDPLAGIQDGHAGNYQISLTDAGKLAALNKFGQYQLTTLADAQDHLTNASFKALFDKVNAAKTTYAINARPVTVQVGTDSVTYDGAPHPVSWSANPGVDANSGLVSGFDLTPTSITTATTVHDSTTAATVSFNDPDYDVTVNNGSLTITPQPATVTTTAGSKVYDGKSVDWAPTLVLKSTNDSVNAVQPVQPTTSLTSADFTVADNAANVKSYQVTLAQSGLDKLQAANPNFSFTALATTFEITQRPVTITLAGGGSFTYDGTTTHTPTVTVEQATNDNQRGVLATDSLNAQVIDDATQAIAQGLTNAGTISYHAKYDANDNYAVTITPVDNLQTITVNKAPATATITAAAKTEDGQVVNADLVVTTASSITAQPKSVTLTNKMYTVANNSAQPGIYTVKINQAGIDELTNANQNYSFTDISSLSGTYTINVKTTTTVPGGQVITVVTTPKDANGQGGQVTEITVTDPKNPTDVTTIQVDPKTGKETVTTGSGTPTTITTGQSTTGTPKVTNNSETTGTTIAGEPSITVKPTGQVTVDDPGSTTGTTIVTTNTGGQIIAIDRTWADGIATHVAVDPDQKTAQATDTLLDGSVKTAKIAFDAQGQLEDGQLTSGTAVGKVASTKIAIDANGVVTFDHLDQDAKTGDTTGQTTTVDPKNPTTPTQTTNTTTVDPTNPETETTVTKGSTGQIIAIDRTWTDGVKTHVAIATDKQATITDTLPDKTTHVESAAFNQTVVVADGTIAGKVTSTTLINATSVSLNHQVQDDPTKQSGTNTTVDPSGQPTDTTVTTTKNPTGGQTIVTTDPTGQVITIDRTWKDGIQTHVTIDPTSKQAQTWDTLLNQTNTAKQAIAVNANVTTDDGTVNQLVTHTTVANQATGVQFNHYTDDLADPTKGPKTGTGLTVDPGGQPTDTKITTTTPTTGGTTTVTTNIDGQVVAIDRTWKDGVQTHVALDLQTKKATMTDGLAGQVLGTLTITTTGTIQDGKSATTTLTVPADLTAASQLVLNHQMTDLTTGSVTGQITKVTNPNGQSTEQQTTTTADPKGGQTVITADPTGQVEAIDRTWDDGVVSHAELKDGSLTLVDAYQGTQYGTATVAANTSATVTDLTIPAGKYAGKLAQTTVTNTGNLATITFSHADLDAKSGDGTGQTTTVDPQQPVTGTTPTTPVSTTTTTTKDPKGGSTTITTGPENTVSAIDRTWSDGVRTHADVNQDVAAVYDVIGNQLTDKITVNPGQQQTIQDHQLSDGRTAYTVVTGLTAGQLSFDHQDVAAKPQTGATGQITTVDPSDPAKTPTNTTTTTVTDPQGGQTTVTTDPQNKVTAVQRSWSDGVVTNVAVDAAGDLQAFDTIGTTQTNMTTINNNTTQTIADGLLTSGPNSQQIASTKITNLAAGQNIQFDHRDVATDDHQQSTGSGTGQTTVVDPTVTDGVTTTKKSTNPTGGTTVVTTNTKGQVITIDRTWPDKVTTHVAVNPTTGLATVTDSLATVQKATETLASGSSKTLADGEVATGETATTTVLNNAPTGQVVLDHFDTKAPTTTGSKTTVDPKGGLIDTTTNKVTDPVGGGSTTTTKNSAGQLIAIDRTWADGVQTHATVDPETQTVVVQDQLLDQTLTTKLTVQLGSASQTILDGTLKAAANAEYIGQVASTVITNTAAAGLQLAHFDRVPDPQGQPTNNGTGQTVTVDPTGNPTNTTSTTKVDPKGGQTTTTTDPTGQLVAIDRTWADGIQSHVAVKADGTISVTDVNNQHTVTVAAIAVGANSLLQDGVVSGGRYDQQTATTQVLNGGTVKTISFDHQDVPTSGNPTGQTTIVDPTNPTQPVDHQTTTFIDPGNGQTIVTTNPEGQVITIDRTWKDGIQTHVTIDPKSGDAAVTDKLTDGQLVPANVATGQKGEIKDSAEVTTNVDNQQLAGNLTLTHGTKLQTTTSIITPKGSDVDTTDVTTTDPEGGQTAITKNSQGQVLTIDRTWKDGVQTHVSIDPATNIATVTDIVNGQQIPVVTVNNDGQPLAIADGTITDGTYAKQVAKTTVINGLPTGNVSLTHEDTDPATKSTTGQTTATDPTGQPTNTKSTTTPDPDGGSVKVTFDAQNRLVAIDRVWFDRVHTHVDVDPVSHLATAADDFLSHKTASIQAGYQAKPATIDDGVVSDTHTATTEITNNSTVEKQGSIALHHQQQLIKGSGGKGQTTIVDPKGQPTDTSTTILPGGTMIEVVKNPIGQVTKITSTGPDGQTVINRDPKTGSETVTDPQKNTETVGAGQTSTETTPVVINDTGDDGQGTKLSQPGSDQTDPNYVHQTIVDNTGQVYQFKSRVGAALSVAAQDYYTSTETTGPSGLQTVVATDPAGQVVKIVTTDPATGTTTVVQRNGETGAETVTVLPTDGDATTPKLIAPDGQTPSGTDPKRPAVVNDSGTNGTGTAITQPSKPTDNPKTPITVLVGNDGTITYRRALIDANPTSVTGQNYYDNTTQSTETGKGTAIGINSTGQVVTVDKSWPDGTNTHVVIDNQTGVATVTDTTKDGTTATTTVATGKTGSVDDGQEIATTVKNQLPIGNLELHHGPISGDSTPTSTVIVDPKGTVAETIVTTTKVPGGPDLQVTTDAEPQTTKVIIGDPGQKPTVVTRDPKTGQITVTGTDGTGHPTTTILGPNETVQIDGQTTLTHQPDGSLVMTITNATSKTTTTIDQQGHVVLRRVLIDSRGVSVKASDYYDNTVAQTVTTTTGTVIGTNSIGKVVTIDQQWPDGTKTHVDLNQQTSVATVKDQLTNGDTKTTTVPAGKQGAVDDGAGVGTLVNNQAPTGDVSLTHGPLTTKGTGTSTTVVVDPDGAVTKKTSNQLNLPGNVHVAVETNDQQQTTKVTIQDSHGTTVIDRNPATGHVTVTNSSETGTEVAPGTTKTLANGLQVTNQTDGSVQTTSQQNNVQTIVSVNPHGKAVLHRFLIDAQPLSVDAAHYYDNTVQTATATKNQDGGTTVVGQNAQHQVVQVNRTWPDGTQTQVTIDHLTHVATVKDITAAGTIGQSIKLTPGQTKSLGGATLATWHQNDDLLLSHTDQSGNSSSVTVHSDDKVNGTALVTSSQADKLNTLTSTDKVQVPMEHGADKANTKTTVLKPKSTAVNAQQQAAKQRLPQTDEQSASGVLALGMSLLTTMLGFLGIRRKHEHQ